MSSFEKFFNEYYAYENGINSRLDEIQASILNFKLTIVEKLINRRREIAKIYFKELKLTDLVLPKIGFSNNESAAVVIILKSKFNNK